MLPIPRARRGLLGLTVAIVALPGAAPASALTGPCNNTNAAQPVLPWPDTAYYRRR